MEGYYLADASRTVITGLRANQLLQERKQMFLLEEDRTAFSIYKK